MRSDKQIDAAKKAQAARLGQSGAAGKRKRCKKGKSCGASCISSSKFCLVDLPWVGQGMGKVRDTIQNRPQKSQKPVKTQSAPVGSGPATFINDDVESIINDVKQAGKNAKKYDGEYKVGEVNWNAGIEKGAYTKGSGYFGAFMDVPPDKLVKGGEAKYPDGVGVKYGRVTDKEIEMIKYLGENGQGPRLIAAMSDGVQVKAMGGKYPVYNGMIAMSIVPGKQLNNAIWGGNLTANQKDEMKDSYIRAFAGIHRIGVAHNDGHSGNVILGPNGKTTFVDLGLAQRKWQAALSEAVGIVTGSNWQSFVEKNSNNSANLRIRENWETKVIPYLKGQGLTDMDIKGIGSFGIRNSDESYSNSPVWGKVSDSVAKKAIEELYSGI